MLIGNKLILNLIKYSYMKKEMVNRLIVFWVQTLIIVFTESSYNFPGLWKTMMNNQGDGGAQLSGSLQELAFNQNPCGSQATEI